MPLPRPLVLVLALTALALSACGEPATARDCRAILDRIVALELAEQGYRDPALTRRKQDEFASRYAADLARCEGLRLPQHARTCLEVAGSSEQVSHLCLH
jgi:hypothetical protein